VDEYASQYNFGDDGEPMGKVLKGRVSPWR